MQTDFLWPFVTIMVSAAFTPGPNNIMITASGANFGYLRSLPHMMGVTLGFPLMLLIMAFGLGELFTRWPQIHDVLRYLGAVYLFYLAWRVATAGRTEVKARSRPLNFLEASAFQWINPKGVLFAISVIAAFAAPGPDFYQRISVMGTIALMTAFASITTWCLFGMAISRLLRTDRALRIFNITMAVLLAGSVILLFV
ncbi:MAG: hypothetical protein C0605_16635 [Hyphomicrobiales bacterium]|nr:MAG: hypothetical protein C0605_16635 [Hyphomicrobiales bacterium]